jgi:hypothetical protein
VTSIEKFVYLTRFLDHQADQGREIRLGIGLPDEDHWIDYWFNSKIDSGATDGEGDGRFTRMVRNLGVKHRS